jgi:hypothetical protein
MPRSFLLILFFCPFAYANAQIINVENARIHSDTTGWMGSAGALLSMTKNTDEIFLVQVNAHVQYKTPKNLFLILGNYGFLSGSSQNLINNSFFHLRYNRKLNSVLRLEFFTQVLQNPVTKIDYRVLTGTGPRFKLAEKKKFRLYAASLVMHEYERELNEEKTIHNDIRSSSYVSFSFQPNDNTEMVNTVFYQPLFLYLNDYRILDQFKFSVKAGKKLALAFNVNYLYDNKPVVGVPRINYTVSTGIEYNF